MATQQFLKGPSGSLHPGKVLPRQPGVCVLQWKLCKVAIPLTGDRVVARQVAGGKQSLLGHASCLCCCWAQSETEPKAFLEELVTYASLYC